MDAKGIITPVSFLSFTACLETIKGFHRKSVVIFWFEWERIRKSYRVLVFLESFISCDVKVNKVYLVSEPRGPSRL